MQIQTMSCNLEMYFTCNESLFLAWSMVGMLCTLVADPWPKSRQVKFQRKQEVDPLSQPLLTNRHRLKHSTFLPALLQPVYTLLNVKAFYLTKKLSFSRISRNSCLQEQIQ